MKAFLENHDPEDPVSHFEAWHQAAIERGEADPSAMALATSTLSGKPSVRIVLLKGITDGNFIFYTHYASRKGKELKENPAAALMTYWPQLYRQVRIEGRVEALTKAESEEYFATRPRARQIAAWACVQDTVIPERDFLLKNYQHCEQQFKDQAVPCPPDWGGYRLIPDYWEFWQGDSNRLHDRLCYAREKNTEKNLWTRLRLAP